MKREALIVLASVVGLSPATASALEFNFRPEAGTAAEAILGFQEAGDLWADLYDDDVTINVDIGFRELGPQILGQTSSVRHTAGYGAVRTALTNDATSAEDEQVVASLPAGPALAIRMNRTSNSPHGPGNATTFVDNDGDANNRTIWMTRANAKALGLIAGDDPGTDASITFNSGFNWDFDASDGVAGDAFSFVFVAAHEIGHALGFVSGVDILDGNSPPHGGPFADHLFTFVSPVDVYRYSTASVGDGAGTIDWSADTRRKYFARDGGTGDRGAFSTGRNFGDGRQASHWRDDEGLGIMDPTAGRGEIGEITALDIEMFDAIGYDPGAEDIEVVRHCREPSIAIPDNDRTGVSDALSVTDTGQLTDLKVEVAAQHSWVGDLVFVLRHENTATEVTLVDRPGVGAGSSFGCSGNDVDATLDSAATDAVESACASPAPALQGDLAPQQTLQAFVGEDLSGTWTLTLSDNARQDRGSLSRWCLAAAL